MNQPQPGQLIVVYDSDQHELGEGTFRNTEFHGDMNLTVYNCEEHTILAKGKHFLRVGRSGEMQLIVT